MRKSDFYSGLVTLLLGIGVLVVAERIPDPGYDVIGPGAFPMVLGVILAVCGVAILLASFASPRAPISQRARWRILVAVLALLVIYAVTMDWLGFLLGTALFVLSCLALLGVKRPSELAAASVGITLSLYLVFGLFLGVKLPAGYLLGL